MAHRNVANALNLLSLSDHEQTCPDLLPDHLGRK
jgi:hypothetical protein